jgi:4-amino-4-deoxy-L-arabinose transferase-like glycosyltransferase
VRLLCALLGLGTLWATWNATRLLAGREAGLLATVIVGLVPMRLTLSAGASNENLATFIAALGLWALAKIARHGVTPPRLVGLFFCLVLGFGAKATCLGLFLAALPVLVGRLGRVRALGFLALCGISFLGLWSPWLAWNRAHYGDWLKEKAAHDYWDSRAPGFLNVHARTGMSFARYFFGICSTGFRSFWATFSGMDRPLPHVLYLPFLVGSGLGARETRHLWGKPLWRWWLGALLYAVFLLGVFVSYNWLWFSAQGRYLYGALIPVGVLLARGYLRVFRPHARLRAGWGLALALFLLNALCLALYPPWK